jgi:uncharacterized protein (DUF983 family)
VDIGALVVASARGLCPRCASPGLFAGAVRFAQRCPTCGLDYDQFNVGDGPAAFLTLILGTLVVGAATVVQVAYSPPFWLQLLIWTPVTTALVIGALRVAKGILITLEYRQAAAEGRIEPRP